MTFCLSADKGLHPPGAFDLDEKIVEQDNEEFISFDQQELFYEHRDDFYNNFKNGMKNIYSPRWITQICR